MTGRVCELDSCDVSLDDRRPNVRFCSRDHQVKALNGSPNRSRGHAVYGVALSVRVPPELKDELVEAAAERMLSVNRLAIAAIREFLDRLIPADELEFTRRVS